MGASPPAILGGPGSTARQESDIRELREERVQHQLAVVEPEVPTQQRTFSRRSADRQLRQELVAEAEKTE